MTSSHRRELRRKRRAHEAFIASIPHCPHTGEPCPGGKFYEELCVRGTCFVRAVSRKLTRPRPYDSIPLDERMSASPDYYGWKIQKSMKTITRGRNKGRSNFTYLSPEDLDL